MATTLFRSHYRVDLTAKQRQVLELVARGRTNFEIAQELGISLDGAKWHLRELFAKLDVDSREEAAEWWRSYNAPGARLSRLARALLPATLGKWLLAGGVSAVVVIGVAVALIVTVGNGGHGDEQAAATTTATPSASPTASASATPSTATPGPSPTPEVIAGLPVQPMAWGDPVPLPQGVVVWYQMAFPYSDGGFNSLVRAWIDSSGELHERDVLTSLASRGMAYAVGDATMARMFAAVCPTGLCGLGVSTTTNTGSRATTVSAPRQAVLGDQLVFYSDDGGVTWVQVGKIPGGTRLVGVVGDQALIGDYREATPGPNYRGTFHLFPSGDAVEPPPGLASAYPITSTDRGIEWVDGSLTGGPVYDAAGRRLFAPDPATFLGASFLGALPTGQSYFTWFRSDVDPSGFLVRLNARGEADAIYNVVTHWAKPLTENLVIGTALYPDRDAQTRAGTYGLVLLDLEHRTITPVDGLTVADSGKLTPFLTTVVTGAFAEVHTGGDCLNVRQEASASSKSLGCFADGVLLRLSDGIQSVDGMEWQWVLTPSGAAGWASSEYLIR